MEKFKKTVSTSINKHSQLFLILSFAFFFRLIAVSQSLWLDEAIGAIAAKNYTYKGIVTEFLRADNHPPLYYLSLKAWTSLWGFSDSAIRMFSVLAGVATVGVSYEIAKFVIPKKKEYVSFLVGIFIATSQFHIYYSQEARMYIFTGLFASLLIFSLVHLLFDKKISVKYWLLYALSLPLFMFEDYVPVFLLPVFVIAPFVVHKKREWWKKYILAHIPLFLLGIVWWPYFHQQTQQGGWLLSVFPDWWKVAGGATFKHAALVWIKFTSGRISIPKPYYYVWVVLVSAIFIPGLVKAYQLLRNSRKKIDTKMLVIWMWLIVPLVIGFPVSYFFPAFNYFRFTYCVPALYILFTYGSLNVKSKIGPFLIPLLVFVNLFSVYFYATNVNQQREDWKRAVEEIDQKVNENEVIVFGFPEPFAPYRWYSKDQSHAVGVTNSIVLDPDKTKEKILEVTSDTSGVYYFEYLRGLVDSSHVVYNSIEEDGFSLQETYNYPGVGFVYYFTKNE